jgi:hypothetical protein
MLEIGLKINIMGKEWKLGLVKNNINYKSIRLINKNIN